VSAQRPNCERSRSAGAFGIRVKTSSPTSTAIERSRTVDLNFKIGEKGGVSVYGLGRFPVTLYYEQWKKLLASSDELLAFLEQNKGKLKLKE
jgi:Na+/H+-translocating membrane pyrophosphatase